MTHTASPAAAAAPARACYFVRFASAVHGGPVDEPVYATSPAEALAIFTAQGPAVRVLSVGGPDFTEHDPADLVERPAAAVEPTPVRMEITEYTITGDDLQMLLSDIEQGGGLDCGTYKLAFRVYPASGKVAFLVNDSAPGLPMGEVTRTIRASASV
jgi:hypothetical protein